MPSTIDERIIDKGKIEVCIPTSIYSPIKKINFNKPNRYQTDSRILYNYLIPNKNLLLQNLPSTFNKSFLLLIELFSYLYEIFLVIFIFVSSFTALILMVGSFNRLFKVSKRKSKQIVYK